MKATIKVRNQDEGKMVFIKLNHHDIDTYNDRTMMIPGSSSTARNNNNNKVQ